MADVHLSLLPTVDLRGHIYGQSQVLKLRIIVCDDDGSESEMYKGYFNVLANQDFVVEKIEQSVPRNKKGAFIQADTIANTLDDLDFLKIDNQESKKTKVWFDPNCQTYIYDNGEESFNINEDYSQAKVRTQKEEAKKYTIIDFDNDANGNVLVSLPENDFSDVTNLQDLFEYSQEYIVSEASVEIPGLLDDALLKILPDQKFSQEIPLEELDFAIQSLPYQPPTPPTNEDDKKCIKQRKTILFSGDDSDSGQTIQNIAYNDPTMTCGGIKTVPVEINKTGDRTKKKYQCDNCKNIFNTMSEYRQHMKSTHSGNGYTRELRARAVPAYQPPEEPTSIKSSYTCSECNKVLKDWKKFENHRKAHGNPDLECQLCMKVYASKASLKIHMKIHNRKYNCGHCTRTYANEAELKKHMKRSHTGAANPVVLDSFVRLEDISSAGVLIPSVAPELLEGQDKYKDDQEEKSKVLELNIGDNLELADQIIEESCYPVYLTSNDDRVDYGARIDKILENELFKNPSKSAKYYSSSAKTCNFCRKTFNRISDIKRHHIEHMTRFTLLMSQSGADGIATLVCRKCGECFKKVDKLKAHFREHAKLTIYKCTFCDKSFSDSSNFSKHKKTHGSACYQCDLCQRKFHSKKMLVAHIEFHNTNVPIQCPIKYCSKVFHFESTLKKHMKSTHHREATSRFKCGLCDYVFGKLKDKWDHEWEAHKIRKNIVDCSHCNAQFRKYTDLRRHCNELHGDQRSSECEGFKSEKGDRSWRMYEKFT